MYVCKRLQKNSVIDQLDIHCIKHNYTQSTHFMFVSCSLYMFLVSRCVTCTVKPAYNELIWTMKICCLKPKSHIHVRVYRTYTELIPRYYWKMKISSL